MVPADRLETTEAVGHGTEHDGRVLTEASATAVSLGESLLTANDGVVLVNVRSASVSNKVNTGRLDEVHAAEGADAAHADTSAVLTDLVLDHVGDSGVFTKVVRHVRVDEADVHAAFHRRSRIATKVRNSLADQRRRNGVASRKLVGIGSIAAVGDVAAANKDTLNDLVDRVSHVVTNDVRSVSIDVQERAATKLRRGRNSVAVLGKGHGNGRVAKSNSGHIRSLGQSRSGLSKIVVNVELNSRARVRLVGRLNVGNHLEHRLATQREVGKLFKCSGIRRHRRSLGVGHDWGPFPSGPPQLHQTAAFQVWP